MLKFLDCGEARLLCDLKGIFVQLRSLKCEAFLVSKLQQT